MPLPKRKKLSRQGFANVVTYCLTGEEVDEVFDHTSDGEFPCSCMTAVIHGKVVRMNVEGGSKKFCIEVQCGCKRVFLIPFNPRNIF
jgi:hypothetical protein